MKRILAIIVIGFMAACNNTSTDSTSTKDSSVIKGESSTTVSPGTMGPAKNDMQDSSMNNLDSGNLNKR